MAVLQQRAVTRSFAYLGWTIGIAAAVAAALALDAAHDVTDDVALGAFGVAVVLLIATCAGRDSFRLGTLRGLLTAFSACQGVFFGRVVELVDAPVLAAALGVGAGVFMTMSLWGVVSGRDFTWLSSLLGSALLGPIGVLATATLFGLGPLLLAACLAGAILFALYTAHDVHWILDRAAGAVDADAAERISIDGALALYLDLANLLSDCLSLFQWFGN